MQTLETTVQAAHGARVVYETLAEVLLNVPTEQVLADLQAVANAIGCSEFDTFKTTPALEQRFYDRFFVATSPFFIPLSESSIADALKDGDTWRYGPTTSIYTDQVECCYRQIGFDYQALEGFTLALLQPDALTCELAFMAFLAKSEAEATSESERATFNRLAAQFHDIHLGYWVEKAAAIATHLDNDFYARVCQFVANWTASDRILRLAL